MCYTFIVIYIFNVCVEGENIARGKTTSQGPLTNNGQVAERAVDGSTNGDIGAGSCAHPQGNQRAYWTVNLGGYYTLKGIRIYNRNEDELWSRY